MITFKDLGIYGRLGNQMHQIASTIGIARSNGHDYVFPEWKYKKYMSRQLPTISDFSDFKNYEEPEFTYRLPEFKKDENISLHGYFQSKKYWADYEMEVKSYFLFKVKITIEGKSCSISVRRGDYLQKQDTHTVLDIDYYKQAISALYDNPDDVDFYIFSDDIEWCKDKFDFLKKKAFPNSSDFQDLFIMANCQDNIIANSSFSWWAAELNTNPDKKVVAPKKWFNNNIDTKDLYNENWIRT